MYIHEPPSEANKCEVSTGTIEVATVSGIYLLTHTKHRKVNVLTLP